MVWITRKLLCEFFYIKDAADGIFMVAEKHEKTDLMNLLIGKRIIS